MIDIIMPAYNAYKTIEQTLLSICSQTISPLIKVYIIDDCSEKPYDYLKDVFKKRLDITIIRNETNMGPGACRNIGLDNAKGDYIFFLDSDDLLFNCYSLENAYNTMEEHPDVALVSGTTAFEEVDGDMSFITNHNRCLHAKMYRRSYIEKYKLRFSNTSNHEDAAFHTLFLVSQPEVKTIKNNLYFYRYNRDSITKRDKLYDYYSLGTFIDNALWVVFEAEKRKFNKIQIGQSLFASICFVFFIHLNYLDQPDIGNIYRKMLPVIMLYNSYDKFVNKAFKYTTFYGHSQNYLDIPPISYYEFVDRINKSYIKEEKVSK